MGKKIGIRQILLLIILVVAACVPLVIKTPYLLSICITTFFIGSCSLSWSILGGLAGQNSLGHAAFMALGAYISTLLLIHGNVSPWISMIIVFFVVGAIAALLLSPCFILRGPYFSLVTIAFSEAFRNLFLNWKFAGQGQGLTLPFGESSFTLIRFSSKVPYYYIALAMLIAFYIVLRKIDLSKLGYALKTIREDEDTANAIGINPLKYKAVATFISAGMIAVSGVFYASYIRYINPDILLSSQSVQYVMPGIIGGLGSVTGPLLGSVILTPLSEYLNATLSNIASGINLVVYAIIIILVILFQPSGIMGWYTHSKFKIKVDHLLNKIDGKIK